MSRRNTLSAELIESRCEKVPFSGCWIWSKAVQKSSGYGMLRVSGRPILAHRASWMAFRGETNGLHVLHKCDVRQCANPDHLFLGTDKDNSDDMMAKGRNRHPYGEGCHLSKLSEGDAREIFHSSDSYSKLGKKFGVTVQAVYAIKKKKSWRHLWAS